MNKYMKKKYMKKKALLFQSLFINIIRHYIYFVIYFLILHYSREIIRQNLKNLFSAVVIFYKLYETVHKFSLLELSYM